MDDFGGTNPEPIVRFLERDLRGGVVGGRIEIFLIKHEAFIREFVVKIALESIFACK